MIDVEQLMQWVVVCLLLLIQLTNNYVSTKFKKNIFQLRIVWQPYVPHLPSTRNMLLMSKYNSSSLSSVVAIQHLKALWLHECILYSVSHKSNDIEYPNPINNTVNFQQTISDKKHSNCWEAPSPHFRFNGVTWWGMPYGKIVLNIMTWISRT